MLTFKPFYRPVCSKSSICGSCGTLWSNSWDSTKDLNLSQTLEKVWLVVGDLAPNNVFTTAAEYPASSSLFHSISRPLGAAYLDLRALLAAGDPRCPEVVLVVLLLRTAVTRTKVCVVTLELSLLPILGKILSS